MKFLSAASKQRLIALLRIFVDVPIFPLGLLIILLLVIPARIWHTVSNSRRKPRLLWGASPIKSLSYMANALKQRGYKSHTVVLEASPIYKSSDFDFQLLPINNQRYLIPVNWFIGNCYSYYFFIKSLFCYDIFHYYFDGGILRRTLLQRWELSLLKTAGKKIVVFPYGSDAFVYDLIPNPVWRHALLTHYPMHADVCAQIQRRIRRMSKQADIVIACLCHYVNLPKWDILPLTVYPIDTKAIQPRYKTPGDAIVIAHATNHRGIKGTLFLAKAVERLVAEGINIKLDIIEKVANDVALQRIAAADIYVDQLVFGYALAALEGMALGKVVISTLEDTNEYNLFRTYSYLSECPIISANVHTIYEVLKALIANSQRWPEIGAQSRQFVEKRHSFTACADMFEAIYAKIWDNNQQIDLINYYHPLYEKPTD